MIHQPVLTLTLPLPPSLALTPSLIPSLAPGPTLTLTLARLDKQLVPVPAEGDNTCCRWYADVDEVTLTLTLSLSLTLLSLVRGRG